MFPVFEKLVFALASVPLLALGVLAVGGAQASEGVPVPLVRGSVTYEGELFFPKNPKGAVPLVVVVHEWWGKTEHPLARARRLADEQGVAALAVDLFGGGKTVETPAEAQALAGPFYSDPQRGAVLLQEFVKAAAQLAEKSGRKLDLKRTYAIGFCFGGTQVLNLARMGDALPGGSHLAGVASFHGGLGSSLHFSKGSSTQVLVLNGAIDPMVKPEDIAALKADAAIAGVTLRFVDYPGATHAFTNPKATAVGQKYQMPIAYHADADHGSWEELVTMLKVGLKPNQKP